MYEYEQCDRPNHDVNYLLVIICFIVTINQFLPRDAMHPRY